MYLTHSFVAIKKGEIDYLLFYLTEDYVEGQVALTQQLNPMLEDLGRNLLDKGAVVTGQSHVTFFKKGKINLDI